MCKASVSGGGDASSGSGGETTGPGFVIADDRDNVATVVATLTRGTAIAVERAGVSGSVVVSEDVPFGHKFALTTIAPGENIIKYGETIGSATHPIRPGEHVHVHNVEGLRGRGDRS